MPTVPGVGAFDSSLFGSKQARIAAAQGTNQALQGVAASLSGLSRVLLQMRAEQERTKLASAQLDLSQKQLDISQQRIGLEKDRYDLLEKDVQARISAAASARKLQREQFELLKENSRITQEANRLKLQSAQESKIAGEAFAGQVMSVPDAELLDFLKTATAPKNLPPEAFDEYRELVQLELARQREIRRQETIEPLQTKEAELGVQKTELDIQRAQKELDLLEDQAFEMAEDKKLDREQIQARIDALRADIEQAKAQKERTETETQLLKKELDRSDDVSALNQRVVESVAEAFGDLTPEAKKAIDVLKADADRKGEILQPDKVLSSVVTTGTLTSERVQKEINQFGQALTDEATAGADEFDFLAENVEFGDAGLTVTEDFVDTVRGFSPDDISGSSEANKVFRRTIKEFNRLADQIGVTDDTRRRMLEDLFRNDVIRLVQRTMKVDPKTGLPVAPKKVVERFASGKTPGQSFAERIVTDLTGENLKKLQSAGSEIRMSAKPRDISFMRKVVQDLGLQEFFKTRAEADRKR